MWAVGTTPRRVELGEVGAVGDEGRAAGLGGRAVHPGVAHDHDALGLRPACAHDAEPVGIRLELHHVVARDDQVEVRAETEAREHDVGDDAIVIGPDGGGEAELLHRDDGLPRERDEGRLLHRPPLMGDGDRHDLGLEVGRLAPHDGQQLGA